MVTAFRNGLTRHLAALMETVLWGWTRLMRKWWSQRVTAFPDTKLWEHECCAQSWVYRETFSATLNPKQKNAISGTTSLCLGGMMGTSLGTQATSLLRRHIDGFIGFLMTATP